MRARAWRKEDFNASVRLPPGLEVGAIRRAIDYMERELVEKSDWKCETSKAGEGGGGRTHTFGVKNPAKRLAGCAVYQRQDVVIRDGKPIPRNGNDS